MVYSAFDDRSHEPGPEQLAEVLGPAEDLWNELVATIRVGFEPLAEDWTFSGKKWGWALRLKRRKRAILYMTPRHGHFMVGFALGQKAVTAAHESDLSRAILDLIDGSQQYAEGRAVRIEVQDREALQDVLRIADIKMAN